MKREIEDYFLLNKIMTKNKYKRIKQEYSQRQNAMIQQSYLLEVDYKIKSINKKDA